MKNHSGDEQCFALYICCISDIEYFFDFCYLYGTVRMKL